MYSSSSNEIMIQSVSLAYILHISCICKRYADLQVNINVYCYAFLNLETRKTYISMFTQMFQILEDIDEFSTRFSHISEREKEIRTIIVNICKKQASDKLKSTCVIAYAEYV